MVQMGRQALNPPGEARQDLWIIQQMARGWGWTGYDGRLPPKRRVRRDAQAMPRIAGITWERLEREHAVTYPCENEGDPGQPVVFIDRFPTPGRPRRFVPAD
jgi:formate dehydrogenase major subunit